MSTFKLSCKVPDIVERRGYVPLRIDTPKTGESFLSDCGTEIMVCDGNYTRFGKEPNALRLILRPPSFQEGAYYWNASGKLRGPLRRVEVDAGVSCLVDQHNTSYQSDGWPFLPERLAAENKLLPGEVTVWKPLRSLARGVYHWSGSMLTDIPCVSEWSSFSNNSGIRNGKIVFDLSHRVCVLNSRHVSFFNDWNVPPEIGYYDYTCPDETCSVAVYRKTLEEIKGVK